MLVAPDPECNRTAVPPVDVTLVAPLAAVSGTNNVRFTTFSPTLFLADGSGSARKSLRNRGVPSFIGVLFFISGG